MKHSAEVVVLAQSLYASGLVAAPITFSFTGKVTQPITPPPLSSFDFAEFSVLHLGFDLRGTVDTLVCTAGCDGAGEPGGRVLEPRSLALLGIGLAVLAISRRRTKA